MLLSFIDASAVIPLFSSGSIRAWLGESAGLWLLSQSLSEGGISVFTGATEVSA